MIVVNTMNICNQPCQSIGTVELRPLWKGLLRFCFAVFFIHNIHISDVKFSPSSCKSALTSYCKFRFSPSKQSQSLPSMSPLQQSSWSSHSWCPCTLSPCEACKKIRQKRKLQKKCAVYVMSVGKGRRKWKGGKRRGESAEGERWNGQWH